MLRGGQSRPLPSAPVFGVRRSGSVGSGVRAITLAPSACGARLPAGGGPALLSLGRRPSRPRIPRSHEQGGAQAIRFFLTNLGPIIWFADWKF